MRSDGAAKMRAIAEEASALVREYKGALFRRAWRRAGALGVGRLAVRPAPHQGVRGDQGPVRPGRPDQPRQDRAAAEDGRPHAVPLQARLRAAIAVQAGARLVGVERAERSASPRHSTAPGTGGDPSGGFAKAVEMCNNNGHCRKFDAGTMCPSFRVTRDEKHLTRGRANTLRLALSGQLGPDALTSDAVRETMDLCVCCKGCKRECPTGVDMARMKIEFRRARRKRTGLTLRDKLVGDLPRYGAVGAAPGAAANCATWRALAAASACSASRSGARCRKWRGDTFLRRRPSVDDAATGRRSCCSSTPSRNYFEPEIAARRAAGAGGGRAIACRRLAGARRARAVLRPHLSRDRPGRRGASARRGGCSRRWRRSSRAACRWSGSSRRACSPCATSSWRWAWATSARAVAEHALLFEEFLAREQKAGRLRST